MLHPDLIDFAADPPKPRVKPWKPNYLTVEEWRASGGPDYKAVLAWRIKTLKDLRADKGALRGAKAYYAKHTAEFIMHWMDTYDPRRSAGLKWMPFILFERQYQAVRFLDQLEEDQQNGLFEKARDMGVTWIACAWQTHRWLFKGGFAGGFGSRKEDLVDQPGIVDSIFEKIRMLVRRVPDIFLPEGFNPVDKNSMPFMRVMNPANGATIAGESGDNIGRGGRKSVYMVDEAAHIERPEKIEASLGDNTNVRIDISSVNGLGNVFYRRARAAVLWVPGEQIEPGKVRKFVFDWRDHPEKTQEWYDRRKQRYIDEGLEHVFAQEVDRNYAASVENTVIPVEWIWAAVDADEKLKLDISGGHAAGLDVADGGVDRNALAIRKSIKLNNVVEWGARDPGVSTRMVLDTLADFPGIRCEYDCIGVGVSVKSEYNRVFETLQLAKSKDPEDRRIDKLPVLNPWNAGAKVLNPRYNVIEDDEESPYNGDFFGNLKAQAWWALRTRFWRTFQMVRALEKPEQFGKIVYPVDSLISISSKIPLLSQLVDELAQPTRGQSASTLKMIINKQPENTKSPNLADAVVMAYYPLPTDFAVAVMGSYGTE